MIKIIADSTCDLSDAILKKYNISTVPLNIMINNKNYKDRVDIQPEEFYQMLPKLKKLPTTSMPSPGEFSNEYKKAQEQGFNEILCICMSSGTSGSYQSALIAKKEYLEENNSIKIHVVDSKCMSHGSGYLILKSSLLKEKGATFSELVDFNETYKTNVKHFLSVDDLNNLIKSGRLTNVSAMIGKLLRVKPIMSMRNGKGAIVAKVRGTKKVYDHYISEFKKRVDEELTDFIIIGYTSDLSYAKELKKKLIERANLTDTIYVMQMGVSVGTHVGLRGLSMYFIEKGHRHDGLVYNQMNQLLEKKDEILKMMDRVKNK
ncbi:MAG: DegV family protein [Eubacteriales bacterium]